MKYLVTSIVEDVDMGSQEAEVTSSYDPPSRRALPVPIWVFEPCPGFQIMGMQR